jgi:uncharacterized protein
MLQPRLIVLQPTPYCNINCEYCYLRNRDDRAVMAPAVLEAITTKILPRISPDAEPSIVWHAGEPTVVPLSWYERAYGLLRPTLPKGAAFSLQSNGISISDEWIGFLKRSDTHIGLSIDGPQRFHNMRRKTRAGGPTWALVVNNLRRLQAAGIFPNVISVLHPSALGAAAEFYRFYCEHGIEEVSFSIDEAEGANGTSTFEGSDKEPVIAFLNEMLHLAWRDGYLLHIREVERVAHRLTAGGTTDNEQIEPWQVIVVAANGDVTTFSPEFMELRSRAHNDFCFGNILRDDFDEILKDAAFTRARDEIARGIEACRDCRYFGLCGGGAPANKMMENGSLASRETLFCRLSIQAAADAMLDFLESTAGARPAAMMTGARQQSDPLAVAAPRV